MELPDLKKMTSDGKIFGVSFIKRTNGEIRNMVARTGVASGGDWNFEPSEHNLLRVYDMQAKGFRHVPVDGILWVKAHGKKFTTELGKLKDER